MPLSIFRSLSGDDTVHRARLRCNGPGSGNRECIEAIAIFNGFIQENPDVAFL